jgi:hypothetical protein
MDCEHGLARDHVVARMAGGRRLWRCTECGRVGPWTRLWRFFGNYECKLCGLGVVDRVLCAQCARKNKRARDAKL